MNLVSSGRPLTEGGFEDARDYINVDDAALWALLNVETRGVGFLPSRRPAILFERHVFHKLTEGRFDKVDPDISRKTRGGYAGGAAEYLRLNRAAMLDQEAAYKSTSWGIGQLMGFNHELSGFANVNDMVAAMVKDEDTQLKATADFLVNYDIGGELMLHAWTEFAAMYNGIGFVHVSYAKKLAAAYKQYQAALPNVFIRASQVALLYLGCNPGPIDGLLSPRTRAAVLDFQRKRRMNLTGVLDEQMMNSLEMAAFGSVLPKDWDEIEGDGSG